MAGRSAPNGAWSLPIDWEALQCAFANNAPEVHSYLHRVTGDVVRVVDGRTDPQLAARIAADTNHLRVPPASGRDQYRWMEHFARVVAEPDLGARLSEALRSDEPFRHFREAITEAGPEHERWLAFRGRRLHIKMKTWLRAHALDQRPAALAPLPAGCDEHLRTRRRKLRMITSTLGPHDLAALVSLAEHLRRRSEACRTLQRR